ncbi:MAG: GTP cyclohydrolase I [Xanthomonadales bacterium PRO7]|jgi:GTP cyclohydrolase I|nr:GTP cyclohydrolase I [Xanthomonadales bacterium PRO7]
MLQTMREAPCLRQFGSMPASERIRERLKASGARFHANDNIADHLELGDIEEIEREVEARAREMLRALVIDVDSDHNSRDTAKRLAKMFVRELFCGRYEHAPAVTEFPNVERLNELMIVGPLSVRSACSHHLCPIIGRIWIGVIPSAGSNLIGLSKYARLVNWIMSRPQIQEEAVSQVANLLEQRLEPDGIAVVLEADHYCMRWRGVKDDQSRMVNSVMRGRFLTDSSLRGEFLSLLPRNAT